MTNPYTASIAIIQRESKLIFKGWLTFQSKQFRPVPRLCAKCFVRKVDVSTRRSSSRQRPGYDPP